MPGYPNTGFPNAAMANVPDSMTNPGTRTVVGGPTPGYNPQGVPFPPPYIHNPGYNTGL